MDRITDSGSVGCGSIPHGGTKNVQRHAERFFVFLQIRNKCADNAEDVDDV